MTRSLLLAGACLLFMGAECGAPPPGPQNPAACPPPTIAQCQDPQTACDNHFWYLGKIDKDSPCSLLLSQAAVSAAGLYAEKTVLTPKTYSGLQSFAPDGGTTKVHAVPEDSALSLRGGQSFTFGQRMGTAFDLRSPDAVVQLAARQKVQAQVDAYNANGNGVATCEEYAFEKFFDIAAWDAQVLISNATDDHRRAFELAYGPSTVRTSIGTRHLFDPILKARDGSPSGISVPFEVQRPKNDYFRVPHGGTNSKVWIVAGTENKVAFSEMLGVLQVTVKDLSRDLSLSGVVFQDAALTPILNDPRGIVAEDFAWHRQMSLAMQNAGVLDEALDLEQERRDAFLKLIASRDEVVRQIAAYASGGKPPPVAGGNRFSERWWDSPYWNPDPNSAVADIEALTVQETTVPNFNQLNNSQQTFITYSNQVNPAKQSPSSLASLNGPNIVQPCKGSTNPFFCLIARLEGIDQALEDALHAAQDRGCLDLTKPTACDWTPRDFTERLRGFADAAREAAYRTCDESVDSFLDLKTRSLVQDHADGGVGVNYAAHDYTTSTSELDLYFRRQNEYLAVVGEVVGPLLERKPVDGHNKLRLARTDGESKTLGDKWFGASMHYGVGFAMEGLPDPNSPEPPDGDCVIKTRADAEFGLDAQVLTATIPLVSAFMHANDKHFSAKVQVFDQQWDEDTDLQDGTVPVFTDGQMAYQTFLEGHETFAIGYILISIGASVGGGVGYTVDVQAGRKTIMSGGCQVSQIGVYPTVIPLTFVEGQAYAALEAIVARAGIKGHLTIASISVPIAGEVSIGPTETDPTILDAHFQLGAELRMRFFGGRISVFVEVGVCPLCASFEADLLKWNGIERRVTLFDYGLSVRLGDLKRVAKQQGVLVAP